MGLSSTSPFSLMKAKMIRSQAHRAHTTGEGLGCPGKFINGWAGTSASYCIL